MAQIINTNIQSLNSQRNLNTSQSSLSMALQRLSSGLRINSAKDDAAGLAISDRMTSQIRGLNQAVRNANDGISLAQTAESALSEVGNLLQRMRELSIQSANATNSDSDRLSIQSEVSQLKQELTRIANNTTFNGQKILNGSQQNIAFHVGAEANQTIGISIGDSRSTSVGSNVVFANNTENGAARATSYNRYVTEGLNIGKVGAAGTAYTTAGMNNGYTAQTLTIRDSSGSVIQGGAVGINASEQASDIAARLNRLEGVTATAYNQVKLSSWAGSANTGSVTFTISSGAVTQDLTLSGVDESSGQSAVFAALKNAINNNAALQNAGVTAGLDSSSNLVIRNNTGADMGVELTGATAGAAETVNMTGSDISQTTLALTSNAANNARRVGGQLNVFLANGYTAESSVDGVAGNGFFKSAANTAVTAKETNVGIADVVSGQDTANRYFGTGLVLGTAQAIAETHNGIGGASSGAPAAQTIKIRDASGNVVGNSSGISVAAGATVKSIVGQLNSIAGVTASGWNRVTLTDFTPTAGNADSMSISINGTSVTASGVTTDTPLASVNTIYAAFRDAINGNTTLTNAGISASINASGTLDIVNNTGDDFRIVAVAPATDSYTLNVVGTDQAATKIALTSAGGDGTYVSGQMSIALADGYSIESSMSGTTAAAGGLFNAAAGAKATAATTSVAYGNSVAAQTLTVNGSAGQAEVAVSRDDSAETIASRVNAYTSTTGVTAEAHTEAKLSNISAAGTVTFSLYGSNSSAVTISAAVTGSGSLADMSALANAINQKAETTGVRATLTDNNSSIVLSHGSGANIVISDFTHSAGSVPNASNISGTDASIKVTGLTNKVDGSGAISTVATTATTLHYGGVSASGADSTVVGGTLSFKGSGAFDVMSNMGGSSVNLKGGNSSLFSNDANVTNASAFSSVNGVDVSTVAGANNAIAVIDAALNQVNSIRSALGAVQNRMQTTISNLTAGSENITAARSRIQDADFAQETANLTRAQILQQAGVAMLAQANQLPQMVLSLLK